jgi:hypothetical protein
MKLNRKKQPIVITSFRQQSEAERIMQEQLRHEAIGTVIAFCAAFIAMALVLNMVAGS